MDKVLVQAYKLVAELLSYPEDLNLGEIEQWTDHLGRSLVEEIGHEVALNVRSFVQDLKSITAGEYIDTLELAPRCPLYLGYWAFLDEGADSPSRRKFMSELLDVYHLFGLSLGGKELPDYLPVVVEFLWISLGKGRQEARTRVITQYALPWLPNIITCLEDNGSPYARLLKTLQMLIEWDLRQEGGIG